MDAIDPDSIERARTRAKEEAAFWEKHLQEYRPYYADQYIAVLRANGEMIAAGADPSAVLDGLREKHVEFQDVWMRVISGNPRHIVL
jgi:hypothetical protein